MEFLSYNANHNIFNSVTLIVEKTAAGYYDLSYMVNFIKQYIPTNISSTRLLQIKTSRFLFANLELEMATLAAFVAFLIVLLLMTFKKAYGLVKSYKSYLKSIWNIMDIAIIIMSVSCIILFMYRVTLVGRFLKQLEVRKHNEFIDYFWLFDLDDILSALAGLLVCIATVRLWKLLRFGVKFIVLEKTIINSAFPLLCMMLYQLVFLLAFGFVGYLLFGSYSLDFKDPSKAINSLTFHSLNLYRLDYELLTGIHGHIGVIYYSLFMVVTTTIYTLYVTVIIMAYEETSMEFSNQRRYTVQRFIKEELMCLYDLWRARARGRRLRAGGDTEPEFEKVYPKTDEFRYADCYATSKNKMKAMNIVARSIIATKVLRGQPDTALMRDAVHSLFRRDAPTDVKSERFLQTTEGGHVVLVDDKRLCQMEVIVSTMCNAGVKRKVNPNYFEAKVTTERFDYILDSLKVISSILKGVNVAEPGESTD